MTSAQMVTRVKDRTHSANDLKIIGELNSSKDWAYNRVYNSENGPDLLGTWATEITLASRTRDFNIGADAAISGTLYGIKKLWLKLTTDVNFVPLTPMDSADSRFMALDAYPASDTTTVLTDHPGYYDVINFAKVRFAPPLPSGAVLRLDYWRKPPDIDPTGNNTLAYGDDMPEPTHEPIVDKATAQMFANLDNSLMTFWEGSAERKLETAMYLLRQRHQGPVEIQPYRRRR